MTLVSSGPLGMWDIHQEFGRGHDLNAYRGVPWWTDAGASGNFSAGQISIGEFYGKRVSSPRAVGIQSFYGIGATERGDLLAGANLGAAHPHRYIVVMGYWTAATTGGADASGAMACTVGGVALGQLWYNKTTVTQTETTWRGIFGGYIPNGTSADIRLTPGNTRAGKMICAYGLIADNVRLLASGPGDLGKWGPINMPASSVILAVANNMNVANMTPTNITKHWEDARTGEATGSFYNFAHSAQTVTVDTGGQGGRCAFVLLDSPA